MSDQEYDKITELVGKTIEQMLAWKPLLVKKLEHGAYLSIRSGSLGNQDTWWVAVFEAVIGNDDHLKDLPDQEVWGEYALISIQIKNKGLVIWTFEDHDLMVSELARLFNFFQINSTEN